MKESTEPLNVKNFAVIHNSFSYESSSRTILLLCLSTSTWITYLDLFLPPPFSFFQPLSIVKRKKKRPTSGEWIKKAWKMGARSGSKRKFPIAISGYISWEIFGLEPPADDASERCGTANLIPPSRADVLYPDILYTAKHNAPSAIAGRAPLSITFASSTRWWE